MGNRLSIPCPATRWIKAKDLRLGDWLMPVGEHALRSIHRLPTDIRIYYGALGRAEAGCHASLKEDFSVDEVKLGIAVLERRIASREAVWLDPSKFSKAELQCKAHRLSAILDRMHAQPDGGGLICMRALFEREQAECSSGEENDSHTAVQSKHVCGGSECRWVAESRCYMDGPYDQESPGHWQSWLVYTNLRGIIPSVLDKAIRPCGSDSEIYRRFVLTFYGWNVHPLVNRLLKSAARPSPTVDETITRVKRASSAYLVHDREINARIGDWSALEEPGEAEREDHYLFDY